MSVDGTDFCIYESGPFDSKWYLHKFKGLGIWYKVGVAIQTGNIVWTNGWYPCGRYPDRKIARDVLNACLEKREKYVEDGGYRDGCTYANTATGNRNDYQKNMAIVRARHETVNRHLKQFKVLHHTYRHELCLHKYVFLVVANLTQMLLENGEPLFDCYYDDNDQDLDYLSDYESDGEEKDKEFDYRNKKKPRKNYR